MVASLDTVKIVMGGFVGTTDRWSTSNSFRISGGTPSAADMNGLANAAGVNWATLFWDLATHGFKAYTFSTTSWDECKTYYYPAGSGVATVSGNKTITPDFGTNGGAPVPPQIAIVVSLLTGAAGRKNRGRNYLPGAGTAVTPGRINSTVVDDVASTYASYLTAMNSTTVGALSFDACIGTGLCPIITQTSVDNVFDTQRRRRDKQVSSHTTAHAV